MNFDKWQKLNESINFSLGIKNPSVFFINQNQRTAEPVETPAAEVQEEEPQSWHAQTVAEIKAAAAGDFDKSFDEYCPFKENPKIGTKEFEDAFDKSLEGTGFIAGQKFSDGVAEDVLLDAPKEDEVMPLVNKEEAAPAIWDRDWQQFNWEDDWNKEKK